MDTYEKKYKEALERAMKLKENPQSVFNEYSPKEGDTICDYIFPELKESEDEKIRKYLIRYIDNTMKSSTLKSKLLAWLEKQGEQKPFDYENAYIQQKDFAPKETVKEAESNLTPLERKVKDILFSFHVNAADGISFDGTMAIVHNLITLCQQEQKPAWSEEDINKPNGGIVMEDFNDGNGFYKVNLAYLNEEQVKEIEELVKRWDGQPKEDEDESIISDLLDYFDEDKCLKHEVNDIVKWLKTIKPQQKGWSDNEIKMFDNLITYLDGRKGLLEEIKRTYIDWLKSIKSRVKPKQEWSEEDQNALEDVREAVVHYWGGDSQDILLYWLKSLKQRIAP